MPRRIIPVENISPMPSQAAAARTPYGVLVDTLNRPLRALRISVTDQCNFRCVYCMPRAIFGADYPFLPQHALLSFEEIERLARIFIMHGVTQIRLTGGEPLLRKNIEQLIERLARLTTLNAQALELTLTTNGALLSRQAHALKQAGLTRVTVSLDSLHEARFKHMSDTHFSPAHVLAGIAAAQAAGLTPLKVNMVVKRGVNDAEIVPMAAHFKGSGIVLRFIEYMDVGTSNHWNRAEVLPSAEVIRRISAHFPLVPLTTHHASDTAQRWRYLDGSGEIGVISSVTHAFCSTCTRARLSAEGMLYRCLFASSGYDLRTLIRGNTSDTAIAAVIARIWETRDERYSQLRSAANTQADRTRVEMSYIGG